MITVHQLSKSFATHTLFDKASFSLNPGDCVGLVGPNGCGKTTLMRLLTGEETPTSGTVTVSPPTLQLGYLPQGFVLPGEMSLQAIIDRNTGDLPALENQLAELASSLARAPEDEDLQAQFDGVLHQLEAGSSAPPGQVAKVLAALGLDHIPGEQPVGQLSGGQQTRLGLALLLLKNPQVLLLDEPTNHLDLEMILWLEEWLHDYVSSHLAAALVISHDRAFLDNTVTRILEIDPEKQALRAFAGNYTSYTHQVEMEHERAWAVYRDQQAEIRRQKQDIARTKQQSLQVELSTTSRQPGVRRIAKKVAQKAKSREKKLARYLADDDRVDKPQASWRMKLEFTEPEHLGKDVLRMDTLSIGYSPESPLLHEVSLAVQTGEHIALTGPNGSGKSTLLHTIAGGQPPLQGSVRLAPNVQLGMLVQKLDNLPENLTPLEIALQAAPLSETEARAYLHYYLFSGDDALRQVGDLSYGERTRLALANLVLQGCTLLLLDEPTNHLDIPSRQRFESALTQFKGAVIAVIHDRYFIERWASRRWHIYDRGIQDSGSTW